MRRSTIVLSAILSAFACTAVQAAPVTFDVTPTFAAPEGGGPASGYRAYQTCDLAAQTSTDLIGPALSGSVFSFVGDSEDTHTVCVRAYNARGNGAFATVGVLSATLAPPGSTSTTYTCALSPVSGGTCSVAP